jgi:hypothetical protein
VAFGARPTHGIPAVRDGLIAVDDAVIAASRGAPLVSAADPAATVRARAAIRSDHARPATASAILGGFILVQAAVVARRRLAAPARAMSRLAVCVVGAGPRQ